MSDPLKSLAEAVVSVMGEMESLPKDGVNSFQNYSYTTEAMVANTIRPLLVKNGLALIPHNISVASEGSVDTGKSRFQRVVLSATYMLLHKSGESLTVTVPGEGMDSLDKSTTKALTAAFKYALLQMFCVGRGDDGDAGNGYGDRTESAGQSTRGVDPWRTPPPPAPASTAVRPPFPPVVAPKQSENAAVRSAEADLHRYDLTFGKHKGKELSHPDIDAGYLKWLIEAGENDLKDPEKARYHNETKQRIRACLWEIQRRAQAQPAADDPNEPPHPANSPGEIFP